MTTKKKDVVREMKEKEREWRASFLRTFDVGHGVFVERGVPWDIWGNCDGI